ncbi:MAG: hypothetical protein QM802_13990 [Agriterribacter sp.]
MALLTGIIYWSHLKDSKLFWLPFFLAFILFVELSGSFLPYYLNLDNAILYNCSIPLEYLFYSYLFYVHGSLHLKKSVVLGSKLFCIVALFYFVKIPVTIFHYLVLMIGQVLILIYCCLYIYERFIELEGAPLIKNYFFWIVAGLLLFNLGDFSYSLVFPLIRDKNWDDLGLLFKSINNSFLFLLYLSYIIAIIICKKYPHYNA